MFFFELDVPNCIGTECTYQLVQESKNLDAGILDCRICQHRKTWGGGDEQRFDDGQVRPPVRQFSGTALLFGWAAMLQRNPKNEQKALVSNLI